MNPRVHRSRVTHERWLVSYADFITLLFAFFVVLYAFARADQKKPAQVSAAIDTAFHSLSIFPGTAPPTSRNSKESYGANHSQIQLDVVMAENVQSPAIVKDDLNRVRRELEEALSNQIAQHIVSIRMGRDGLVISLREAGFFNSGSATPRPESLGTLRQIADSLGSTSYAVRIEGHTDNVPIHNAEFHSNWELSSARATRTARTFIDIGTLPPDRLSAAGYAEFHPAASNETADGRAENRRVDLVVLPSTQINFAVPDDYSSAGPWRTITEDDIVHR